MNTTPFTGEQVAKRVLFLAYTNSKAIGRGILQERKGAKEEDVWQACRTGADYPGAKELGLAGKPGEADADYVLGRMVKLELRWTDTTFTARCWEPDVLWGKEFRSVDHLIEIAMSSLRSET